jgi:23S rRNA (cytosine1962-C5)-methyltransferase
MRHDKHLTSLSWGDYALIDSGEHVKLERIGDVLVARPETQALWKKAEPELWKDADAVFGLDEKKGAWKTRTELPDPWILEWNTLKFSAKLNSFKHIGFFPEQAPNWAWISDVTRSLAHPKVLNLFGYTGVASLAAAEAGASVTHVDASKQSIAWARENAQLSEIPEDSIRWILDDALAFVKREARRGSVYEGIILDPPAFGRGAKGEVWKIEEDLLALLMSINQILSKKRGSFLLVNGYAAGYAARSFAQVLEDVFGKTEGESGELYLEESAHGRVIPSGIYARFVR